MGHRDTRGARQPLAVALPSSLQTGNRIEPRSIPEGSSYAQGRLDAAHHVSNRQADFEAGRSGVKRTLRARFPQAAWNDADGLSPGVLAREEVAEKENHSHFRQKLAVFDKKQSLTTICDEIRLPFAPPGSITQPMESLEMFFQSSRGIFCLSFILLSVVSIIGQTPDTVVASVNGSQITQKQVDDSVAAQILPLQQQLYAIRKAALDNLIVTRILESEATAKGILLEDLRRQLTVGEINVTRQQVEEAYSQNASFFASMSPDEARERLRLDLENQARMRHYRAGLAALRQKWSVKLSFSAPPFVLELDDGVSPAKGAKKPVVTIAEFSDFECPYCIGVQAVLKQVMQSYEKDVRLVFKHMPLEGHRNSLPAARAAYCAAEQDRFWEFHDALFAARDLSPGALEQIAAQLGLGLRKFQSCVSSEQSRNAVVKDIEAARVFRVDSTPSFVINGQLVKGALTFADFQKIIERELSQRASEKPSATN